MVVFNSVLLAIIQSVLLFVNVKTLTNIKYTFRDYIAMICIIIPSTIIYYFISEKTTILLLIAVVIFMYIRKQTIGVVAALISFFILYMANFISIWLATQLIEVITLNYIFSSFYAVSFILIA
ncbi:K+-sensing histidine kinase KdpD, partial [Staphylococcus cohnii]